MARTACAAGSVVMLASCATSPVPYSDWLAQAWQLELQSFTVADIKRNPATFLAEHNGKRVLVLGFFEVTRMVESSPIVGPNGEDWESCYGRNESDDRSVEIELPLTGQRFQDAAGKWVVVEARVNPPRVRALGHMTVVIAPEDQLVYLDRARILAVDSERECKIPSN